MAVVCDAVDIGAGRGSGEWGSHIGGRAGHDGDQAYTGDADPGADAGWVVAAAFENGGKRGSGAVVGESEVGAEGVYQSGRNLADGTAGVEISFAAAGSDYAG